MRRSRHKGITFEGDVDVAHAGRGNLVDLLYKKVSRPALVNPVFVIHHPLDLSPLARKNDANPAVVDRFQLVVNGWEIVNAYSELVDPIDQAQRFEEQAAARAHGDLEAMEVDNDFLLCMEYGMPPISGWGMGVDRVVALLTNAPNLRDVDPVSPHEAGVAMARPFELFVAMRYLRGRRRMGFISFITWTSAAGVFLGSLVLVVALSIANGFEKEVRDRIVGITAHAKILQYYGRPIANYDSLRLRILKCPNVVAATPYIMEKGGIEYESVKEGVMITGAIAATETTVTEVGRKITFGKFALDSAFSSRNRKLPGIVLGIGMADKMGVRPGAEVVVGGLTAEAANGEITSIPMARFVVRGIFETGMYEYDLNLVYISIQACQSLFSMNGVEGIAITHQRHVPGRRDCA